nr:TolC family protein [Chitinispirillaceae bacterium]
MTHLPVKLLLLCLFTALACGADTLSLDGYVQLTLRHSPNITIAASRVASSAASAKGTRSGMLPGFSAHAGLSRSNSPSVNNALSTGISAQTLLFDFGQTPLRVRAAGINLDAATLDRAATIQSIIVSARTAYYTYLLTRDLRAAGQNALRQAQLHLEQAKVLFEVGKQPKPVVIKAEVDVAAARIGVIRAENAHEIARMTLESVAGISLYDPLDLTDSLAGFEDTIELAVALTTANTNRSELKSAFARRDAARLLARAAKSAYFPSLNGSAGYDWSTRSTVGIAAPEWSNPGWSLGAALSIPLFDAGKTRSNVQKEQASLMQAGAELEALIRAVSLEVKQAVLQEKAAREQINATTTLIAQASESLTLSQERFRAGSAASLEIIDAELTMANAQASLLQAQFDYRVAHTNLLA